MEMVTASPPDQDLSKNDLIQILVTGAKNAQARCVARLLECIKYYDGVKLGTMSRIVPVSANKPSPEQKEPTRKPNEPIKPIPGPPASTVTMSVIKQ